MVRPFISVIIVAQNEGSELPLKLMALDRWFESVDFSYEFVVIDRASTDGTSEILERFGKLIKGLRNDRVESREYGEAVRRGIEMSRGTWRLFLGCPERFHLDDLKRLVARLDQNIDVVLAVRGRGTGREGGSVFGNMYAGLLNLIIRRMFKSNIRDFLLPLRCFSERAAIKIYEYSRLSTEAFDVESIILAESADYTVETIPVALKRFPQECRPKYIRLFYDVLKIRFWLSRRYYTEPLRLPK